MRTLTIATFVGWMLALTPGCGTSRVELFPEGGADASLDAASDGVAQSDAPDATIDGTGAQCVCRFARCRTSTDCQAQVGAGSVCDASFVCTGATSACTSAADCAGGALGWICAESITSTTSCP
jgi:hypothetical protein